MDIGEWQWIIINLIWQLLQLTTAVPDVALSLEQIDSSPGAVHVAIYLASTFFLKLVSKNHPT